MIFATLHDIRTLQQPEKFRSDLYYRLRAHHIHVPPLRERKEDISQLVDHFLQNASAASGKNTPVYPVELMTVLKNYSFPGNVRELKNMVYDAVSTHSARTLSMESFKTYISSTRPNEQLRENRGSDEPENPFSSLKELPTLKEATSFLVEEAMRRADGKQSIAAKMLGITRQALNWRLKNA
jgi:DNA-binding NtrC family response regulator